MFVGVVIGAAAGYTWFSLKEIREVLDSHTDWINAANNHFNITIEEKDEKGNGNYV